MSNKVFNIDELRAIGLNEEQIKSLIEKGMAVEALTPKERTRKEKIADAKWETQARFQKALTKVKNAVVKTANWISENKTLTGTIAITALGAYRTYANYQTHKMVNSRYEDIQLKIYDPKERHYWYLRRPLTNDEMYELRCRYINGENYYDILNSMGVLR